VVVALSAGCHGSVAHYLGILARSLGRKRDAARWFDKALAMHVRMGARAFLAHTQAEYACVLLGSGDAADQARARTLLDEAARTAAELGMRRLERRLASVDTALQADAGRAADPAREARVSVAGEGGVASGGRVIFRQDGEYWTVSYAEKSFRLKHTKGLGYLAVLLAHPGQEFHVLDLGSTGDEATSAGTADVTRAGPVTPRRGDAGEVLDASARAAYKHRLQDLGEELEEAQSFNDIERARRVQDEIDELMQELSRGMGLGGRSSKGTSVPERARLNVTRAISAVVKKIALENPVLGQHLNAAVRTGLFCSYTPDPRLAMRWEL
jgi:non-specific serine/threonine protein kinase